MKRLTLERLEELQKLYRTQANQGHALPWSDDVASTFEELIEIRKNSAVSKVVMHGSAKPEYVGSIPIR